MQYSQDGFDGQPREGTVEEGQPLYVYRVHGSSRLIGRFFFTPQVAGTPRMNWTADMLERELNAALWDNDFRYLARFRVLPGTRYQIGPIAQGDYMGRDDTPWGGGQSFVQFSYFEHEGMFSQVHIPEIARDGSNWRSYLELLEDLPINPGRFHRTKGKGHC